MNMSNMEDASYLIAWYERSCLSGSNRTHTYEDPALLDPEESVSDLAVSASKRNLSNVTREWCQMLDYLMNAYEPDYDWSIYRPDRYLVPVLFGLTFAVGMFGNGLVVYVVLRSGSKTTVTNLYLMNLAIADLLFLLFCVPFTGTPYIVPGWPFGQVMCKIVNYMMVVTMGTTIMTMMSMSIDRYHAVVHPVCSKAYRTPKCTSAILGSIWGINTLAMIPVALISKTVQYWDFGKENSYCIEHFLSAERRKVYTLCVFTMYYAIPLMVIGLSYYLMSRNLWASVSPGFLRDHTSKARKCRKRVSKMVLIIVAVFALCWLPIHCFHLYTEFGTPINTVTNDVIKIGAHVLSYMNSAMNPVIYGFMSENFRTSFKVACGGIWCRFRTGRNKPGKVFIVADPEAAPESIQSGPRTHPSTSEEAMELSRIHLPPKLAKMFSEQQIKVEDTTLL